MIATPRTLQIRANSLVVYNTPTGHRRNLVTSQRYVSANREQLKEARSKAYNGNLSDGAVKRLSKAINLLVASAEKQRVFCKPINKIIDFKLGFVTLTVPDNTPIAPRKLHKLCLEPFLRWCRNRHGMVNYVWKVEEQKRGQLHYHLTIDVYIDHVDLRNYWNKLVDKALLMEGYKDEYSSNNPNSTDVHSVKRVKDLASYLVKYFCKKEQNGVGLDGKIWDCSTTLKKAKYYTTEYTHDIEKSIYAEVERGNAILRVHERFDFVSFKYFEPIVVMPEEVKEFYVRNLLSIRCGLEV